MATQTLVRKYNVPAIQRASEGEAYYVPHLGFEEIKTLARVAREQACKNQGERDELLIQTMFDGCFRVSEAVSLTPKRLIQSEDGWAARFIGKGDKVREAAISSTIAGKLLAYAYNNEIRPSQRLFPITPTRVWQMVDRAFDNTDIQKPGHVGAVHVLRHSGLIARLEATGNPKSIQDQAGHQHARMTLRYLKTVTTKESLRIQQQVDFRW